MLFSTPILFLSSLVFLLVLNDKTTTLKRLMGYQLVIRSLTIISVIETEKESRPVYESKHIEEYCDSGYMLNRENGKEIENSPNTHYTATTNHQTLEDMKVILGILKKNQFHQVISRVSGVIIQKNGLILTRTYFNNKTTQKCIFIDYAEFEASWWYTNIVFSLVISTMVATCWDNDIRVVF